MHYLLILYMKVDKWYYDGQKQFLWLPIPLDLPTLGPAEMMPHTLYEKACAENIIFAVPERTKEGDQWPTVSEALIYFWKNVFRRVRNSSVGGYYIGITEDPAKRFHMRLLKYVVEHVAKQIKNTLMFK